jgi:ubiquinone/menaquinone biosynthesis C-methylase UbiE
MMLSVAFRRVRRWFSFRPLADAVWASMCRGIQRAQHREIRRLCTPRGARKLGVKDAFCRLARWLPPPGPDTTVLELGCGPGKYVGLLSGLGYRVAGVDPLAFPEWDTLRRQPHVTLRNKVFAERLPYPDRSFDHVACLGALLYFADPAQALREMYRVLKPGGRLVLRTVNRLNYYTRRTGRPVDPSSRNLYDMDQLTAALRGAGFAVEDQYAYGFCPPFGIKLFWYFLAAWCPYFLQDLMSWACPARSRWSNIVLASRR